MTPFAMMTAQHSAGLDHHRNPPQREMREGVRRNTQEELAALAFIRDNPDTDAGAISVAIEIDPELLYPMIQRLRRWEQIYSTGRVGNGNRWRAY